MHIATAVGSDYTAKYDPSGNKTCRPPTSSLTCTGTITGHKLTYDNEGRLTAWQNEQSSSSWAAIGAPCSSQQRSLREFSPARSCSDLLPKIGSTHGMRNETKGRKR
jgi:YD repeat-containing protein